MQTYSWEACKHTLARNYPALYLHLGAKEHLQLLGRRLGELLFSGNDPSAES